ncbi:hypothetical protein M231_04670 [Tremella mesenterica]|uniref:Uncharacterized protein n=1 Tax=Tremella mesenterica TaxID=5217 RepID=A0A4Q1BK34_TREME|nr:hypothetical protein M231_04670 [Tremella mesenterica]
MSPQGNGNDIWSLRYLTTDVNKTFEKKADPEVYIVISVDRSLLSDVIQPDSDKSSDAQNTSFRARLESYRAITVLEDSIPRDERDQYQGKVSNLAVTMVKGIHTIHRAAMLDKIENEGRSAQMNDLHKQGIVTDVNLFNEHAAKITDGGQRVRTSIYAVSNDQYLVNLRRWNI